MDPRTSASTTSHARDQQRQGEQVDASDEASRAAGWAQRSGRDPEFVALVSHELRHVTGVVAGFLDLLVIQQQALDERQARHLLVRARANTHRMVRLLEDLTVAMQLDAGRFSFDLRPLQLLRLVRTTTDQLRQTTGRIIQIDQPPSLPPVLADHDRQIQILTNLLSNAVKYSPDDSVVHVILEPHSDEVLVKVHNVGRPAATGELGRLFEPFIRLEADADSRTEGVGLGLYITKLLVEGQGGSIAADNDRHHWTFSYTIPRASAGATGGAG